MDSRKTSRRTAAVLLVALASGLACTAIFKPRDDVQRCGTGDDCEPTGDNRYDAVCRFDPENVDLDSTRVDRICVAEFKVVPCEIPTAPEDHALIQQIDDCDDLVIACDDDKRGSKGCPAPNGGSCNGGLEPNEHDICDEPDSDERIVSDIDFRDQAIQDMYCKSFFCDERFVCDTSGGSQNCVLCDPDLPFGEGGCGTLYANGEVAPFYVLGDDLQDDCAGPDAQISEPLFGECP